MAESERISPRRRKRKARRRMLHNIWVMIRRALLILGVTIALVLFFCIALVLILLKGPSAEAKRLFTLSANETSALGWLPPLFLSDEEYDSIINPIVDKYEYVELSFAPSAEVMTDGTASTPAEHPYEIIDVKGSTYKGKMMLIHDPSRVSFASIASFGDVGMTLSQFLSAYNAIACTNAGGFEDENGTGKGGIPDGIVIQNGQITYGSAGAYYSGFAGFDANHILHVGNITGQDALNMGIVSGTSFNGGPVLIQDGVRQTNFISGINPRTCIGQTSDGTVILVAVEGRMIDSMGATFDEMADLMLEYGAVNATNMDGGSSSGLYYNGERLTRSCSVVGDRPLPTAIIVTGDLDE